MVFAYEGTLSFSQEIKGVALKDLQIGDMFLKGDNPGHCVIVVDMTQDKKQVRRFF